MTGKDRIWHDADLKASIVHLFQHFGATRVAESLVLQTLCVRGGGALRTLELSEFQPFDPSQSRLAFRRAK